MTEPDMSPQAAAAEIGRLEKLRQPLEHRTLGVTWMIWGLATAGIFVSYAYAGLVVEFADPQAYYLFSFLWAPWVAMGVLSTAFLYRSVGLVMPRIGNPRRGIATGLLFFVASFGMGIAIEFFQVPIVEPALFLGIVGLVCLFLGTTGLTALDAWERRAQLLGGIVIIASALPSFAIADENVAYAIYGLGAPLVTVLVYFTIGILMSRRG